MTNPDPEPTVRLPSRNGAFLRAPFTVVPAIAVLVLTGELTDSPAWALVAAGATWVAAVYVVFRRARFLSTEGVRFRGVTSDRLVPWQRIVAAEVWFSSTGARWKWSYRDGLGGIEEDRSWVGSLSHRTTELTLDHLASAVRLAGAHGAEVAIRPLRRTSPYRCRQAANGLSSSCGIPHEGAPPGVTRSDVARVTLGIGAVAGLFVMGRVFDTDDAPPPPPPDLSALIALSDTVGNELTIERLDAERAWKLLDAPTATIDCTGAIPYPIEYFAPTFVRVVGAGARWEVAPEWAISEIDVADVWSLADLSDAPRTRIVGEAAVLDQPEEVWVTSFGHSAWFVCERAASPP